MIVAVAALATCALALLTGRSMAAAFSGAVIPSAGSGVDTAVRRSPVAAHSVPRGLTLTEGIMLVTELLLSVAIVLVTLGLMVAVRLPGHLVIGAILAQVAVLGAILVPASPVRVGRFDVHPEALALGVAQLASIVFFVKALLLLLNS